jgi:hypothetical protein
MKPARRVLGGSWDDTAVEGGVWSIRFNGTIKNYLYYFSFRVIKRRKP